ncbi:MULTISPECIES: DUF3048 domain-containing protein [Pontibacillus]|uniref:DUF3048 domain-containing protein n=1 Tax=Pontibacillus chungwhensis TaxID=265426 RepID=A0ABY8V1H7_9BACI|nr:MULTISPECIES: DUF3048 domain-containing protein [Pontibacillus]MCD5325352.1 DUF3048 domain-containing protein [Pontibacillus sp. HN14]WIF98470.1 DUF3048 domain-containing protein [Pontibacillus chungwhensis]
MRKSLGWVFLLMLLIVTACSVDQMANKASAEKPAEGDVEEHSTKQVEQTEKETPVKEQEPEFDNMYPLTGEKTNDDVSHRIMAVMVNNHSYARPQTGLNDADLVYEVLAEGSITRFVAFYHSKQPEVVGPVRSAREYYFNIAKGYNAIYLYHGAAEYIENKLRAGAIDHLNGMYYDNDRNLFKRENFRKAPHNSYILLDAVYDVAKQKGYSVTMNHEPLPFLTEEEIQSLDGQRASNVKITYSNTPQETVTFKYNPEEETYARFNDGEATVDYQTKEATTVDNIFIVETGHRVIDSKLRRAIDLQSGGNGYLIQKGQVQQVTWKNENGRLYPFKDGKKLGFVPGKTWVNIVPEQPGLSQSVSITSQ